MKTKVAIKGAEFFAYHGVYAEEQKIGNRYQIDIQITTDFSEAADTDKLKDTVNYGDLYEIIAGVMKIKAKLLEHIAQLIISSVRERYPNIEKVEVLTKAIEALNEKDRTVLNLYYYEGLTLKQIGTVLTVSESRVCQLHSRAIRNLKENMKNLNYM